MAQPSPRFKE